MCGIVGSITRLRTSPEARSAMLAGIAHRGPDGQGEHDTSHGQWHVHLAHRRLSIIDLDTGAQPMGLWDHDGWITYNGEVYNYVALRSALEGRGFDFRTRSDTEVVLRHVIQHGPQGLPALNGMFAFGVWNGAQGTLTLARDRAGIKPLFYAPLPDGGLLFASELRALLAHPMAPRHVDPDGLRSYLFADYAHAPTTLVAGVHKLPPGSWIEWNDGHLTTPRSYYELPWAKAPAGDAASHARALWCELGDAVSRQLVSDVPVGVFLSGGIDSSIVATLAAARSKLPLRAFSIGFTDPTFDESNHARAMAAHIGIELISERVDHDAMIGIADHALDMLDEPLADPSFLPTYLLSRLAARHVKVVLGGDGGDELFAGYPTHFAHSAARFFAAVPGVLRRGFVDKILPHLPVDDRYQSMEWKLRRFAGRFDTDPLRRHLRWMSNVDLPELHTALGPRAGHADALPATLVDALQRTSLGDPLNDILALDFRTYMSGSVLTKVDRATMAHGLEARPPFLDNAIIDWAFRLPGREKLVGRSGKHILKLAAKGHVPDAILHRPKKGFGIPLATWLRGSFGPRIAGVLGDSPVWDLKLLSQPVFRTWAEEHAARSHDRSKPLWALYVLHRWLLRNPSIAEFS